MKIQVVKQAQQVSNYMMDGQIKIGRQLFGVDFHQSEYNNNNWLVRVYNKEHSVAVDKEWLADSLAHAIAAMQLVTLGYANYQAITMVESVNIPSEIWDVAYKLA